MLGSAFDFIASEAGRAPEGSVVSAVLPAPRVSPEAFAQLPSPGRLFFFDATARGERFALVGRGEALVAAAAGEGRGRAIARASERLAEAREHVHEDAQNHPPSLMAGASPFARSAEARYALPRFVFARGGDATSVRISARAGEALGPLFDEAEALFEGMARLASREAPSRPDEPVEVLSFTQIERTRWAAMIERALDEIGKGTVEKVVVSRQSRLVARAPFSIARVLKRLGRSQPGCVRFAVEQGGGCLVGASPERLVRREGRQVSADALAGSLPRDARREEGDVRRLRGSSKDLHEHAVVVDEIARTLRDLCIETHIPSAPEVKTFRSIHHLFTDVQGVLRERVHALELAELLHPTPAVCGLPRAAALSLIDEIERAPRGLYAGHVGWFDAAGDGHAVVALRCALIEGAAATLFAGGGIVAGAESERELLETQVKQGVMLDALEAET